MPRAKVILFFECNGLGWEEVYYHPYANDDFSDLEGPINRLQNARRGLSPPSVTVQYIRTSDDVIRGDSRLWPNLAPQKGFFVSGPGDNAVSPAFVALLLRLEATTRYRRSLELRGLPAAYVQDPYLAPSVSAVAGGATWLLALSNFGKVLSKSTPTNTAGDSWTIKAQTKAPANPEYRVRTVAIDVPNRKYTLTVDPAPAGDLLGKRVRVLRMRQFPGLVGTLTVTARTDTSLTVQVFNTPVDPGVEPRGLVQREVLDDQVITALVPRRWAHRDTGRPFPAGRGHR